MVTLINRRNVPIETVSKGEKVLSYDEKEDKWVENTVSALVIATRQDTYLMTMCCLDDGRKTVIECTPDHPIYVENIGWCAIDSKLASIHQMPMVNTVQM